MVRLNLQLFSVTTSIVDLLNSQGKDSSFSARKQYAAENGITNYTGTAEQNGQLIKIFSGNNTENKPNTTKPTNTTQTTQTKPKVSIPGVDQSLTDTMNSGFKPSTAYDDAKALLDEVSAVIKSGRTSYTDKVEEFMGKIENFQYDPNSDMLFQQYLSSMTQAGQMAMQDTFGQASMLTGGYGSSYATSAGNQAYNAYLQEAYNNLPEYAQMAESSLYNKYSMYQQADEKEWGRTLEQYGMYNDQAKTLYDQDYRAWADEVANATNLANMQQSNYWNDKTYNQTERQFIASNDLNGDGKVDSKDHDLSYQRSISGSGGNGGNPNESTSMLSLTETEIKKIKELHAEYGDTKEGANAIVDYLRQKGKTVSSEDDWAMIESVYGNSTTSGNSTKSGSKGNVSATVSGFRTTKGDNFEIKIGDSTYNVENEGKVEDKNTINKIKNGTAYGNLILGTNNILYVKSGSNYYQLGRLEGFFGIGTSTKSGYDDLKTLLTK